MLFKGKVEDGTLFLTHLEMPEGVTDAGTSEMNEGQVVEYKLSDLGRVFSVIEAEKKGSHITMHFKDSKGARVNRLTVVDISLRDVFNKNSEFKSVSALEVFIPHDIVFEDIFDHLDGKEEGKSKAFKHRTLTQAITEDSVEADAYIERKDVLVIPSSVAHIEDKGAYRAIFMEADKGAEFPLPIYTETSKAALSEILGSGQIKPAFDM